MLQELSRRERKKKETRDRILAAAREMLEDQGFDATTLEQIAEAADVSIATFYNYFPNKDTLLQQIAEVEIEEIGQIIAEDTGRLSSPLDVIRRAMELFYSHTSPVLRVIRHVLLDKIMQAETVPGPIQELQNHATIIELIRQAQEQDELPSNLDPVKISESIAAAYLSASVFCKYLERTNTFPRDNGLLTSVAMTLIKRLDIIDKNTPDWEPVSSKLQQSSISSEQ